MKYLYTLLFAGSILSAAGQHHYPIFTQNYASPFIVNPSLITIDRQAEVNATFRQQWTDIDNGPQTIQLDVQYPIDPKMSIGINVYNDETILLSSTGALATFGYKVRITSSHIIGFGLSGGMISNRIDLSQVSDADVIDPVLLQKPNTVNFDGQFGLHYRNRNFVLGVSLLKLVDNRPFSEGVAKEKFDPFKDRNAMLGYRLRVNDDFSIFPFLYYRSTYTGYDYFEGALLFNYKDIVTLGGGYRTELGPHVVLRLGLKKFKAGYAYDFPVNRFGGSTGGTNEFQLKMKFGRTTESLEQVSTKRDTTRVVKKEEEETNATTAQQQETTRPVTVQTFEPDVVDPKNEVVEKKSEPVNERKSDISDEEITTNTTYYLVVGVFERRAHAERYSKELAQDGITTEIKTSTKTKYFYVTVPEYTTKAITLERVLEIRKNTQFKDAWFEQF